MRKESYSKILVCDLDGTLYRNGKISDEDIASLESASDLGWLRIIATGRHYRSAEKLIHDRFPADFLIFAGGGGYRDLSSGAVTILSEHGGNAYRTLYPVLKRYSLDHMIHGPYPHTEKVKYLKLDPLDNIDFFDRLDHYDGSRDVLEDPENFNEAFSQIVAVTEEIPEDMLQRIREEFSDFTLISNRSPIDRKSIWLEIYARGTGKADALARICDRFRFRGLPITAAGNEHNDIDILDIADRPFVMPDSPEDMLAKYPVVAGFPLIQAVINEASTEQN